MLKKVLLAAVAVGALSACADRWDVEGVRGLPNQGGAFHEALQTEYAALAAAERSESDWRDTAYFVAKARAAARGETVLPQPVEERSLNAAEAAELAAARERLMARLEANARRTDPVNAARAQAGGFDCWMQEQEEGHQPDDIAACRETFVAAMKALEPAPKPAAPSATKAEPAPQPPQQPEQPAALPGPFIVFFETASARIDATALNVLRAAARAYEQEAPVTVVIAGHADTVGSDNANILLSQRRAEAVADALATLGVPPQAMALEAYGEEQLRVPTPDDTAEPQNRRVEITFGRPQG